MKTFLSQNLKGLQDCRLLLWSYPCDHRTQWYKVHLFEAKAIKQNVFLRLEIGLPPNFYRVEELVKFTFYDLQVPSRAQTIRSKKKGLNFQCLEAYKITNIYDPSFIFLHRVALVATWDSTLGSLCYR